jgi:hypothetical protein
MNAPAPRLPNFLIAGTPNTGTTSLHYYLQQHPQVFVSPVKEPTYFGTAEFFAASGLGDPATRRHTVFEKLRIFMERRSRAPTWEAYLALFRGARDEPAVGEVSPKYLLLPAAAKAIRERIPQARLVFLLRHPADWLHTRYASAFWRDGAGGFRARFEAARDPRNAWAQALNVVRYGTHLQRFVDLFPRDQLRIYLYEDFRQDGAGTVRDMLAYLGVDPNYPIDMSVRHNPTAVPRLPGVETLRQRVLRGVPVIQWIPYGVRQALRRLYYRPRPPLVMDPADRAMVIAYYRDEIERTADLIQRDLSAWLR